MNTDVRAYLVVTGGYWGFTLTDGAIRMLVVLYFHALGYTPFEVAMLFVLYELCGIFTNALGGWLGARIGLERTLHAGMALQVVALLALTVPDAWLTVPFVMAAQALSGVAKDLNKMSAKSSVKTLAPSDDGDSTLFRWVAALTGSKNALKGAGFFVGALGLEVLGFRGTLVALAGGLALAMFTTMALLPKGLGRMKEKAPLAAVFSNRPPVNWLSAARFFLFGARDIWFVVALPVFAYSVLEWTFTQVGTFMAMWIIGYGFVQGFTPRLVGAKAPGGRLAAGAALLLAGATGAIALALGTSWSPAVVVVGGLALFGVVFAVNSAVHSYLILGYSEGDRVAMNVGFYYMANAGGRLVGTLLSGAVYQSHGLTGCLWVAAGFAAVSAALCLPLPARTAARSATA